MWPSLVFVLQEIKIEPVDIDISNDSMDPIDDGFDMNKVSFQYLVAAVLRAWTYTTLLVTGVATLWSLFATLVLICVGQFYVACHVSFFILLCLAYYYLCVHIVMS